jgi:hypothetical protein
MNHLDEVCAAIVSRVDDACAAAVVLVATGTVVGSHATTDEVDPPAMAAIARNAIAPVVRALGPPDPTASFDEIYVATTSHSQFAKVVQGGRGLLVVATRRVSNVGLGWTQVRGCALMIESLQF